MMHGAATEARAAAVSALREMTARLTELLETERRELEANDLSRLDEHSRAKDRMLLDLSRFLARHEEAGDLSPAEREAAGLPRLKEALAANADILERHLAAAREFSGFIEDSIRRHRTDGTYSRKGVMGGYGQW